jgi:hypothetical protein
MEHRPMNENVILCWRHRPVMSQIAWQSAGDAIWRFHIGYHVKLVFLICAYPTILPSLWRRFTFDSATPTDSCYGKGFAVS